MSDKENLFTSERFQLILDYLKKNNRATVDELAHLLYVSSATVRRDLNEMKKLGLIQRTHGGAVASNDSDEVNIFVRIEKNSLDKENTAQLALNKIPLFSSVFIDNSSTCLTLAQKMDFSFKTVITNGFHLALKLSTRKDFKVIFLGGSVQYSSYSTYGSLALDMLAKFHVDLMLSSCASIREDGCYESSLEASSIKHEAFLRSDRHILLVDQSKFTLSSPYKTESLEGFEAIYTNASDAMIAPFKAQNLPIFNR